MRIRMLETRRGTEDGFTINRYEKDKEYDMGESLAKAFLAAGFAVMAMPDDTPAKPSSSRKTSFPRRRPSSNKFPFVVDKRS